jgi:hypothetical protein
MAIARFDTYIFRRDCLTDPDALASHPNVKNVIVLPRDWILYEFHHALFEDPDYSGPEWYFKMERFPALKQAAMEMIREKRALLRPWYEKKGMKHGDASHCTGTELTQYFIGSSGSMSQVRLQLELGWGCTRGFSLRFQSPKKISSLKAVSSLVDDLVEFGKTYGLVCREQTLASGSLTVSMESNIVSSHWIVALWVLVMDSRLKAGIGEIVYLKDGENGGRFI